MVDLRLLANEMIGREFKPYSKTDYKNYMCDKDRKFVITEVFPYHVLAYSECENGYKIRESFSIADLATCGLIRTPQRTIYQKNAERGRDGYGWYR